MARGRTTGGGRRNAPWMERPRRAETRQQDDGPLIVYGANPVLELLRSAEPITRIWTARPPRERELAAAASSRGLELIPSDRAALEHLSLTPHHQGVVAEMPGFGYVPLQR